MAHPPQKWPTWLVPKSWDEQLAACEWMCFISPTLRRIGVDLLRDRLRMWFEAGWTPNDILYSLDRQTTGELHIGNTPTPAHGPQAVDKWLIKRLRLWLDASGRPLAPVYAHVEVRRDQQIARMSQARKEWEAQQAQTALPGTVAALKARAIAEAAGRKSRLSKPGAARRELETATAKAILACAGDSALDQLNKALKSQHS